ncbi:MAG: hypothetical protein C4532_04505 [Candidatus Abyssobacteria bacterium SURF_17]|uniref:Flagellar protein FlgN n=1 Tax=Candidatus Abyssobacteria bacterium SURF_17 TaxID=2093361 RepID=A0A419F4X1_9BACT|nr:MAG: hypothetical protein C4532_04505 [Candidatus Abyssubacteria bacterium SURF_17]
MEDSVGLPESVEERVAEFWHKLGAQAELYRTLLGLTKRQALQIAEENLDGFMLLLEEKKKVIKEIGDIEQATIPLREYWESHKEDISDGTRVKLRSVVDEIRATLEELLALEARSQRELGLAKEVLAEEMRQVGAGRQAMRSYNRGADQKPRFMDETG